MSFNDGDALSLGCVHYVSQIEKKNNKEKKKNCEPLLFLKCWEIRKLSVSNGNIIIVLEGI